MAEEESIPFDIPADKTYAIVEFSHKNIPYSSPVPTRWLFNVSPYLQDGKVIKQGMCYWPLDEKKLSDFTEKRKKPDQSFIDTCITYKVKILRLCGSLMEAKRKNEDGLNRSLLTESDEGMRTKRERKAKKIFDPSASAESCASDSENTNSDNESDYSSSSKDESSDSDSIKTDLQIIKSVKSQKLSVKPSEKVAEKVVALENAISTNAIDSLNTNGDSEASLGSAAIVMTPKSPFQLARETSNKLAIPTTDQRADTVVATSPATSHAIAVSGTHENGSFSVPAPSVTSTPRKRLFKTVTSKMSPLKKSPFKKPPKKLSAANTQLCGGNCPFMKELVRLRNKYDIMDAKLDKTALAMCPVIGLSGNSDHFNNVPALPIEDEEGEEKWETFIQDQQNKAIVISLLANYGTNAGRESTYGILRKLLGSKCIQLQGKKQTGCNPEEEVF